MLWTGRTDFGMVPPRVARPVHGLRSESAPDGFYRGPSTPRKPRSGPVRVVKAATGSGPVVDEDGYVVSAAERQTQRASTAERHVAHEDAVRGPVMPDVVRESSRRYVEPYL